MTYTQKHTSRQLAEQTATPVLSLSKEATTQTPALGGTKECVFHHQRRILFFFSLSSVF